MDDTTRTTIPLRGVRGMVAAKMLASATQTAPVTHHALADVSALLDCRAALKQRGEQVSIEDLVLTALVATLQDHPLLNGTVADRAVHLEARVHISVAIALPDNGLVAPTIFDAHELSWSQ
ncbi:MAG: 2-oxo acid dehydrogenase subunit E2, partial [Myxococcota bacterium]